MKLRKPSFAPIRFTKVLRIGLLVALCSLLWIPVRIPWTGIDTVHVAKADTVALPELPTEMLVPAFGAVVALSGRASAKLRAIFGRR